MQNGRSLLHLTAAVFVGVTYIMIYLNFLWLVSLVVVLALTRHCSNQGALMWRIPWDSPQVIMSDRDIKPPLIRILGRLQKLREENGGSGLIFWYKGCEVHCCSPVAHGNCQGKYTRIKEEIHRGKVSVLSTLHLTFCCWAHHSDTGLLTCSK